MVNFSYSFEILFDKPVAQHQFCLRIKPKSCRSQKLLSFVSNLDHVGECVDGFGNNLHFGVVNEPHDTFLVEANGRVNMTGKKDDTPCSELFLCESSLVKATEQMIKEAHNFGISHKSISQQAEFLCGYIFDNFYYEKGVTDTSYGSVECYEHKRGVCQDFSHLMLAFLRTNGVPCRYVNGYISGDGETHAWVECFIDGEWHGFDPTHNLKITDEPYIKISVGRDYTDCKINHGVFVGSALQSIKAVVNLTEE